MPGWTRNFLYSQPHYILAASALNMQHVLLLKGILLLILCTHAYTAYESVAGEVEVLINYEIGGDEGSMRREESGSIVECS